MSTENINLCMNCMKPVDGNICGNCGHNNSHVNDSAYLKTGTVIMSRYVSGMLRSKNSESAVYMGYDLQNNYPVWIVEYYPSISSRESDGSIIPQPGYEVQFKAALSEFMDICSSVKRLNNMGDIIPIENAIIFNASIYAVYKDIGAVRLADYIKKTGEKIPFRRAVKMFIPLCKTLDAMHSLGDIHRGISPDNIYIGKDGKLYLWGFALSATRTAGSEFKAELFGGFSAPEQYSVNGRQGTWTDVYAAAALFYRTVSGIVPPPATLSGSEKTVTPLKHIVPDIPESISNAIGQAMNPGIAARTQTICTLAANLKLDDTFANAEATAIFKINKSAQVRPAEEPDKIRGEIAGEKRQKKGREGEVSVKYVILALFFTVLLLGGFLWYVTTEYFPDLISNDNSKPTVSVSVPPQSSSSVPDADDLTADNAVPVFVGFPAKDVTSNSSYTVRFDFEIREEFNDIYEEGIVYEQTPKGGVQMPNRGTVVLYVSKGKMMAVMPDVTGMTIEDAEEAFKELSAEMDYEIAFQVMERYDSQAEIGKIMSTIPVAGDEFDPQKTSIFVYMPLEASISEAKSASGSSSSSRSSSSRDNSSRTGGALDDRPIIENDPDDD